MGLQSPLHQRHVSLGAKLADFGGWDMPIEYPATSGGGVIAEHTAVRERVGIFDVSHLGKAEIIGEGALEFLNSAITNDLTRITDGIIAEHCVLRLAISNSSQIIGDNRVEKFQRTFSDYLRFA